MLQTQLAGAGIAANVTAIAATMSIDLYPHQKLAIEKLRTGSILCGGVGSGKSLTALGYFIKQCGKNMEHPKDLYIITTAQKRDKLEWDAECANFLLSKDKTASVAGIQLHIDSWNNITKYEAVKNAFFIFDEQKIVGSGPWSRSFIKIAKTNDWILLSATPGDTWSDYVAVFIANGFYKNRSEFFREHAVYSHYTRYPKIIRFVNCEKLINYKRAITVVMPFVKHTVPHHIDLIADYNKKELDTITKDRWNPFENAPLRDVSAMFYSARKSVNSDPSRISFIHNLLKDHKKLIIFYNYDYELALLKNIQGVVIAEYNGHKHEPIPDADEWLYLVQYTAGAEGWNCIKTNATVFYSQNYSFKIMTQAAGRIDRLNTPYKDLYFYKIRSLSWIDNAILKAFQDKKSFNEQTYLAA